MGKNSRPSHQKREKEKARQERQKEKSARRQAKERKANAPARSDQDPDIAGIVPGPQSLPSEFDAPPIRRQL